MFLVAEREITFFAVIVDLPSATVPIQESLGELSDAEARVFDDFQERTVGKAGQHVVARVFALEEVDSDCRVVLVVDSLRRRRDTLR